MVPRHAAAGKQLFGHAGGQLLLRLEHKALGVEIFGKAGDAVGRRADAAILLQLQLCCAISSRAWDAKLILSFLL